MVATGVDRVAEHEVVEDHDAFTGCQFIKLVNFVLPSSPQTDHVEVGVHCIIEQLFIAIGRVEIWVNSARVHHIQRHIVGSFAVNRVTIHDYLEISAFVV